MCWPGSGSAFRTGKVTPVLVWMTALTTVLSGLSYLVRWARILSGCGAGVMSPRGYRLLFWLGFILIAIIALGMVQSILLPFAAGVVLAFVLAPAVARLERWGIRRSLAAFAVLIVFLIGVVSGLRGPGAADPEPDRSADRQGAGAGPFLQEQIERLMGLLQQHLPADQMDKLQDLVGTKLGEAVAWIATLFQSLDHQQHRGSQHRLAGGDHADRHVPADARLGDDGRGDRRSRCRASRSARCARRRGGQRHAGRLCPRPGAGLPDPGDLLRHRPELCRARIRASRSAC